MAALHFCGGEDALSVPFSWAKSRMHLTRIRTCPTFCWIPSLRRKVEAAQEGWRRVVATALINGIPVPAFTTALNYFDGYRSARLPANMLQAQRDYFGAHTYERVDKPRGEFFHTNWTGRGGDTSSSTYKSSVAAEQIENGCHLRRHPFSSY